MTTTWIRIMWCGLALINGCRLSYPSVATDIRIEKPLENGATVISAELKITTIGPTDDIARATSSLPLLR